MTPARILVVDDDLAARDMLRHMLRREGYEVMIASDGAAALAVIASQPPHVVLLDINMPGMDGYMICRAIKSDPATSLIPVTLLTGSGDQHSRTRGLEAGADDFLTKPVEPVLLRTRVRSQVRLKHLIDQLEDMEAVIVLLARTVEERDAYTEGHLQRLQQYGSLLAHHLNLPGEEVWAIRIGGILHDIGKIGVPDRILLKPGPLTPEEEAIMRQHPIIGERIVAPMRAAPAVGPIVRHHHERWDGQGYPDGLAHDAIPMGARIISVVDAFDAMTTDRPYRRAMAETEALDRLREAAGTQFDPGLVERWANLVERGLHRDSQPWYTPAEV